MPKLVCVNCERELYPEKNGVSCLDMADFGPYELYDCDRWKCPKCGYEVLAGFASKAWLQHWMPDFKERLDKLEQKHTVIKNYGRGNY